MNTTRDQHEHVKILADDTAQSVRLQGKSATFRQLYVYAVKDYAVKQAPTANDNDIYVGLDGDGPLILPEYMPAGDANTPKKFTVPDGLPEMKIEDVWVIGKAGDGVWLSYVTAHPK